MRETGYVSGRYIAENFIVVREIVHHVHNSKSLTILLKLDFFRAFNTLNWKFLLKIIYARGFSARFVE
jgi:hypothetical protein